MATSSGPGAGSWDSSTRTNMLSPWVWNYLTLVYQIDLSVTRLLWVGKERTIESFQGRKTRNPIGMNSKRRSASWS